MMVTIDWGSKIIHVPKDFLDATSDPNWFALDLNQFHLALRDLEDDQDGIVNPTTHTHTAPVELDGVTYSRFIEIINGYSVTFEPGTYGVRLKGANSNVATVTNLNGVSVASANSAGLIDGVGNCPDEIAEAVWSYER